MAVVTVDSSNLADILRDAGVEPDPEPAKTEEVKEPVEGEPKTDEIDPDDVEDEQGLTPREKRQMSNTMLKAVGKKHRQMKDAEEFANAQMKDKVAAERRATDLERQIAELKGKTEPPKPITEPVREDFATDAEFVKASIKYGVKQELEAERAARNQQETKDRMKAHVERARELVPDYQEIISSVDFEIPPHVVSHMQDSDLFAELAYHFAKNPSVMKRLQGYPPVKQLVELGKIEATLAPFAAPKAEKEVAKTTAEKPPTEKPKAAPSVQDTGFSPSKARSDAPVIRPLTSGEGQQVEPDERDMDVRQTIAAWTKANGANLNRRKRH